MMKVRTSLWASMAIATSLGLAGCGGSSDNEGGATTTTNPPPAGNTIQVTEEGVNFDIGLESLEGKDTIEAGKSKEVEGGGELMCAAGGGNCSLTITQNAVSGFTVVSEGGMISYKAPEAKPEPTDPEVSDANAAKDLQGELLGTPATFAEADVEGDDGVETSERVLALKLLQYGFPAVGDSGAELKDPHHKVNRAGATKFKKADQAPVALTGWTGETWTNGEEVLVRYTNQNVETTNDKTFAEVFGDQDGSSDDEVTDVDWTLAAADEIPSGAAVASFPDNVAFDGTYAGVEGEYSCTGTCELQLVDGVITPAGTWTFTADDRTATVDYEKADADYLAFGWWREDSSSDDHVDVKGFQVFHAGRAAYDTSPDDDATNALSGVDGEATYNGHAAGNYVQGGEDGSTGGNFVADVKLTVDFENAPTVEGTINNFRDSAGTHLGKWELTGHTSADTEVESGTFAIANGDFEGAAGTKPWAAVGSINGTFYGDRVRTSDFVQPSGATGWFHAATVASGTATLGKDDVAVAGAFAATR